MARGWGQWGATYTDTYTVMLQVQEERRQKVQLAWQCLISWEHAHTHRAYEVVPISIHSQDLLKLTGVKQLECCCDLICIVNALCCLTL